MNEQLQCGPTRITLVSREKPGEIFANFSAVYEVIRVVGIKQVTLETAKVYPG